MNAAVVPLTRTLAAAHRRTDIFNAAHRGISTSASFRRLYATSACLFSKSFSYSHLSKKVLALGRNVNYGGNENDELARGKLEHFFSVGEVARSILKNSSGTEILAYVSQVNNVALPEDLIDDDAVTYDQIESNNLRCPNLEYAKKMTAAIAVRGGDSVGGTITCIVRNMLMPHEFESLVFDKLRTELVGAVYSIPAAVKGMMFDTFPGDTFTSDSEHDEEIDQSGAIQGGRRTVIKMRIAFGPTSTISMVGIMAQGRNYPCLLPLAVPLVEAAVASEMAELLMAQLFS